MERGISISENKLADLISSAGETQAELFKKAHDTRIKHVSERVYYRGLIEFSNICRNDCCYCGIRKSKDIPRYRMSPSEILEAAEIAVNAGVSSLVLQSGENNSKENEEFILKVVKDILDSFPGISLTLSLGELTDDTLEKLYSLGAERYLLRIETSDPELYGKLHPAEMPYDKRVGRLEKIRSIGYQTGTGVMIGLPFQTPESLAEDLTFMRDFDVDMVGMGPYIPEEGPSGLESRYSAEERLNMTLNMTALLRILMPDINIVAATALQAIEPFGREMALRAGANVIMPLITPGKYREYYSLYDGKPCAGEEAQDCLKCITGRIRSAGLSPAPEEKGDSLHFQKRTKRF